MIELHNAGKTYRAPLSRREVRALQDFSLTLERGLIIGIAGPNGAGKSTLLSLILGFIQPTTGTVRVGGVAPRAYVERIGVGYLPELPALPPRWSVREALLRRAALGGLGGAARTRAGEIAAQLGLEEHWTKQVRQLSKGNLQRLGLAQALIDDRELLILDEPTHGLDPLWTHRFRDLAASLRRSDRLVLVASHNLDELERIADQVAIIHQGRLQRVETPGSQSEARTWRLTLPEGSHPPEEIFPGAEPVGGRPGTWRLRGERAPMNAALGQWLAGGGEIIAFGPEGGGLESAFREAVGEGQ